MPPFLWFLILLSKTRAGDLVNKKEAIGWYRPEHLQLFFSFISLSNVPLIWSLCFASVGKEFGFCWYIMRIPKLDPRFLNLGETWVQALKLRSLCSEHRVCLWSARFPIYILLIENSTKHYTNLDRKKGWERLRSWRDTVKTPSTPQRLQPSARRSWQSAFSIPPPIQ